MRPLALGEIVDADAYEPLRDAYRARVRPYKAARRIAVGDRVTMIFENRETVRFQVQEMLRVERIHSAERVQHELDVYNELVPRGGELSATLFLEITDTSRIRAELDALLGIDGCVFLVLGEDPDALRVRARFDERQLEQERISAVHYLRFDLAGDAGTRLADRACAARIAIEHPRYRAAAAIPDALRTELLADLAGEPAPLLEPPPGASAEEAGAPVSTPSGRVRVRRPDRPLGRGHLVVEPVADTGSWLDAAPDLDAELLDEVKRRAREIAARHGACRVLCDAHAPRLRWHVFAPDPS